MSDTMRNAAAAMRRAWWAANHGTSAERSGAMDIPRHLSTPRAEIDMGWCRANGIEPASLLPDDMAACAEAAATIAVHLPMTLDELSMIMTVEPFLVGFGPDDPFVAGWDHLIKIMIEHGSVRRNEGTRQLELLRPEELARASRFHVEHAT